MKTYQSFARTNQNSQLINTEIKAHNKKDAEKWFNENTVEHEQIYLKETL